MQRIDNIRRRHARLSIAIGLLITLISQTLFMGDASAYQLFERWTDTATSAGGSVGSPVTLTWGFVPEGTPIPGTGPSRLVQFFDEGFEVENGEPGLVEERPWFSHYEETFDRWSQLSGVSFVYEPNDDGVSIGGAPGLLGVRPDIRIGGSILDGGGGVLGAAEFPNSGDLILDTGDYGFFMNQQDNYRGLRHVLMHEQGHSLGLAHVQSDDSAFLMEPFTNLNILGPQLDEIRGLHRAYGDVYEKLWDGRGNNTAARALDLGTLFEPTGLAIGTSVGIGPLATTVVENGEVDFVSIDDNSDIDFYSFFVESELQLTATLTPVGPTYREGPQNSALSTTDSSSVSDLTLAIFDSNGIDILALENSSTAGMVEVINELSLPRAGEYFVRITGSADDVQLYQLDLDVVSVPEPAAAVVLLGLGVCIAFTSLRKR